VLLRQLYSQERTLQGTFVYIYPHASSSTLFCSYLLIRSSQAPKAVQAWKSELTSKKRTKIAATIADPSSNPELFEEGWEEVLAREETHGNGTFYCFIL
jgi:hypothetical protein